MTEPKFEVGDWVVTICPDSRLELSGKVFQVTDVTWKKWYASYVYAGDEYNRLWNEAYLRFPTRLELALK